MVGLYKPTTHEVRQLRRILSAMKNNVKAKTMICPNSSGACEVCAAINPEVIEWKHSSIGTMQAEYCPCDIKSISREMHVRRLTKYLKRR